MCEPTKSNLISVYMLTLLLASVLLFAAPAPAHAQQDVTEIESTMTITMQQSSDNSSAGTLTTVSDDTSGTSGSKSASDDTSGTSGSKSASSGENPATGAALPLVALGCVALCAGAAYCLLQSRKLSSAQGAHAANCSHGSNVGYKGWSGTMKRTVAVIVSATLVASLCFGTFATKASALEEDSDLHMDISNLDVECYANVVIDEEGNVLSANLSLVNNSEYTIDLLDIIAPEELSGEDWEALFEYGIWDEDGWHDYDSWFEDYDRDETGLYSSNLTLASSEGSARTASDAMTKVKPGAKATGTWSGTKVPSDVVSTVRSSGSARLNYRVMIYPELLDMFSWVTFDANAPSGTTATIGGKKEIVTKRMSNGTKLTSDIIPADTAVTCNDSTWEFAGWAENPALLPGNASKNADLAAKAVALTGQKTYYAIWKDKATSDFWLSSTKVDGTQVSDFTSDVNYRTGREILNDVDILKKGSDNSSYATVLERWNGYYDNDVKLYATYSGGESEPDYNNSTSALNGLVEFRILEVSGESGHLNKRGVASSSDGSVVTFMATHVLPTAYEMDGSSNEGGWNQAGLRAKLQSGGEIYGKFPSSLTGAITKVNKLNNIGGEDSSQSAAGTTTNDAFWLLSYSELYSTGGYFSYAPMDEGTAYQWCTDKSISGNSANTILAYTTRAGATPGSCRISHCYWWERSPIVGHSSYFMNVDNIGDPKDYNFTNYRFGVTPCFSF